MRQAPCEWFDGEIKKKMERNLTLSRPKGKSVSSGRSEYSVVKVNGLVVNLAQFDIELEVD